MALFTTPRAALMAWFAKICPGGSSDMTRFSPNVLCPELGPGVDGYTASLRAVFWGVGAPTEREMPCLSVEPLTFETGGLGGNARWVIELKLRIIFPGARTNTMVNDAIGLGTMISRGVQASMVGLEGVTGLEDLKWALTLPMQASQGQTGFMEATGKMQIEVLPASWYDILVPV